MLMRLGQDVRKSELLLAESVHLRGLQLYQELAGITCELCINGDTPDLYHSRHVAGTRSLGRVSVYKNEWRPLNTNSLLQVFVV